MVMEQFCIHHGLAPFFVGGREMFDSFLISFYGVNIFSVLICITIRGHLRRIETIVASFTQKRIFWGEGGISV